MINGIQITDGFVVTSRLPIDKRCWAETINDVNTNLPEAFRYLGLTIFINQLKKEYWFKDGTTNNDFIPKSSGGSGTINLYQDGQLKGSADTLNFKGATVEMNTTTANITIQSTNSNIDGGNASSIYTIEQNINGGGA